MYSRQDHEKSYREAVYGAMARIRTEQQQAGASTRGGRERLHVPTQEETLRSLFGRPLMVLLVLAANVMLAMGVLAPNKKPVAAHA